MLRSRSHRSPLRCRCHVCQRQMRHLRLWSRRLYVSPSPGKTRIAPRSIHYYVNVFMYTVGTTQRDAQTGSSGVPRSDEFVCQVQSEYLW